MNQRAIRFLVALLLTGFVTVVSAQTSESSNSYSLTVTLDHSDALYHVGETATFTIQSSLDKQPQDGAEVQWAITKDGVALGRSGKLKLAGGCGTLDGTLQEPGFLQCRVWFPTPYKSNLVAIAGAGYAPLQIKPSLPVPDDFDAFWAGLKKKLAAVPAQPRLTPVKSSSTNVEAFDAQVASLGAPVSGYFARPAGAVPRSLPIILTVHGAGVRSSILGSSVGWAQQGFLAMDINAHGIPNGQPEKFYTDMTSGELKNYSHRGRESRDTIYFQGMFLRLVRALDFLTAQPEWNGRTVIVHGSSQGGAQSLVAAGLDPRVTFYAAGVPAMCDHTGVVAGRANGWPQMVPRGPDGKPDAKVLEAARYYDAMNFATRATAEGIVTVGFIDTTCPPTSVYAAYNALRGKKEIFNDPPSPHAVSRKAGEAMRKAILRHAADTKERRQ